MKRVLLSACLGGAILSLSGQTLAEVQIPHTFVNGEKADAAQVNENFSVLANAINQQSAQGPEKIDISKYFAPLYISKAVFDVKVSNSSDNNGIWDSWAHWNLVETFETVSESENKYLYHDIYSLPDGSLLWDDHGDFNMDTRGIWFSFWEWSNDINDPSAGKGRSDFSGDIIALPQGVSLNQAWANAEIREDRDNVESDVNRIGSYADQRTLVAIEDVTVPAGSFKDCLKISQIRAVESRMDIRWLCPEVGSVKRFWGRNSSLRLYELQSYEPIANP